MLTTTLSWAQTEAENADEKATPTPTSIEERVGDLERRLEAAEQRATAAEKATHEAEAQLKTTEAKNTEIQAKQTELQGRVEEAEQAAQANEAVLSDLLAHSEDTELLRLYGFADIGWRVLRLDSGSTMRNIQDVPNQFVLGNANLYVDARPSSRFRSLMEIRFTTYPGGTYASQATTPTNTSIMDVNSTTARNKVQLSNIIIVTKLSKAELSRIFRTTKTAWDGGGDIVAVNLPESNELRQAFDEAVLGLDTKNVAKYWIDRKIRGGTRPPRRAPSTSAVLKLVTDEVGAIGYVRADEVERNGLRTVAIVRGGDVL